MDWIRTINRAIAYMEEHLTEQSELEDIAKSVHLSPFHFHRAFSMLTEMSPAEYLRKRRLSQAGAELASGKEKIIDVVRIRHAGELHEGLHQVSRRFSHAGEEGKLRPVHEQVYCPHHHRRRLYDGVQDRTMGGAGASCPCERIPRGDQRAGDPEVLGRVFR